MKLPSRQSLKQYLVLGLINTALVYAVYTPYVFLWLRFSPDQYVRWIEGGVLFGLATGWFYAFVIVRAKRKLFPEKPKMPAVPWTSALPTEFSEKARKE